MNHARAPVGKEPMNHARAPVGKEPLVRGITKGTLGAWDTGARAWFMGFLVRAHLVRAQYAFLSYHECICLLMQANIYQFGDAFLSYHECVVFVHVYLAGSEAVQCCYVTRPVASQCLLPAFAHIPLS